MNTANILLIERGIIKLIKNPSAPIMGFGMSLFFLLVYNAGIGGIGSMEGQHRSVAIVTNAVFPLLFLSTTFLPRELITANWLLTVSWGNPVTYILEGNRYLLGGTSSASFFYIGLLIFAITSIVSITFALSSANKIKV